MYLAKIQDLITKRNKLRAQINLPLLDMATETSVYLAEIEKIKQYGQKRAEIRREAQLPHVQNIEADVKREIEKYLEDSYVLERKNFVGHFNILERLKAKIIAKRRRNVGEENWTPLNISDYRWRDHFANLRLQKIIDRILKRK